MRERGAIMADTTIAGGWLGPMAEWRARLFGAIGERSEKPGSPFRHRPEPSARDRRIRHYRSALAHYEPSVDSWLIYSGISANFSGMARTLASRRSPGPCVRPRLRSPCLFLCFGPARRAR